VLPLLVLVSVVRSVVVVSLLWVWSLLCSVVVELEEKKGSGVFSN
jgi:hypothetical protein